MSNCNLIVENSGVPDIVLNSNIKDTTVIDIGCNQGEMAINFLRLGAQKVVCIEPNDKLCSIIENNIINAGFSKDNFVILNYGLSDKKEDLNNITFVNCWTLGTRESTGLDISPGAREITNESTFNVKLITLDELLDSGVIGGKINFIKIDVDGYEFKVLKGGLKFIEQYRPEILFELSYLPKHCGDDPIEMIEFISNNLKYGFFKINGEEVSKEYVINNFPWNTSCDIILRPIK